MAVIRCGCLDPLAPGRCAHFHVEPAPSLVSRTYWGPFPSQLDFLFSLSRLRRPRPLSSPPPIYSLPPSPFISDHPYIHPIHSPLLSSTPMASLDSVTPQAPQHEKVISRPYKCPYPLCGRAFSRLEHQVCTPHYMRRHEAQAPSFDGFLHRHHVTCRHLPSSARRST